MLKNFKDYSSIRHWVPVRGLTCASQFEPQPEFLLREPVVQEHLQAGDVGEFQSVDDLELCDVFTEGLGG